MTELSEVLPAVPSVLDVRSKDGFFQHLDFIWFAVMSEAGFIITSVPNECQIGT